MRRISDLSGRMAASIEPHELRSRIGAAVREHAGTRNAELELVIVAALGDFCADTEGRAVEPETLLVEVLSEQRVCANEEEVARLGESNARDRICDLASF